MKVLSIAVLAVALSLVAVFGAAAVVYGAAPSGPDAAGFAAATAVTGAALIGALHWPVLAGLRRRGVALDPTRATLITALGLNAPVYAVLAVVGRNRALFAGGEAALLALGFALIAVLFGAGYAGIHRHAAAKG
ncbi:MAG: hypothetical protein ABR499_05335 [Gemmatimonadaceae bacterium]